MLAKFGHLTLLTLVLLATAAVHAGGDPVTTWMPISPVSSSHPSEWHAAAAYNSRSQGYLVVWDQADNAGNSFIFGQLVAWNGTLVDSRFLLPACADASGYPDVAYNPARDEYLVVFESGPTTHGVCGVRLHADGSPAGAQLYLTSSTEYSFQDAAVAYATRSDEYLVVWQKSWGTAYKGIEARSLSGDGTALGSVLEVTGLLWGVEPSSPDVAYTSSLQQFLVVWQKWYDTSYTDHDIMGQRVGMAGGAHLVSFPFGIHATLDDEIAPAVASLTQLSGAGEYLVACQRDSSGTQYVDASLVAVDGTLLDLMSVSSPFDGITPAVAGNENTHEFLVAWSSGGTLRARTVTAAGDLGTEAPAQPYGLTPSLPAIAGGGLGYYLVTSHLRYSSSYPFDVYGFLWGDITFLFNDRFESGDTSAWSGAQP
jgi:hypothetical protein